MREPADIVVIGAGVAGTLVAWRLAQGGAKVLVLEAGPPVDRAGATQRFQYQYTAISIPRSRRRKHPTSRPDTHRNPLSSSLMDTTFKPALICSAAPTSAASVALLGIGSVPRCATCRTTSD